MPYTPGRTPFLPKAAIAGLKTAAVQVLGGLFLLVAGLLTLALATYASSDPSFNTASDGPVHNALGRNGALVADLGLQGFGIGAWIPVLGLGALGLRMFLGRGVSLLIVRIPALLVAMVFLCGAFDLFPAPASWRAGSGVGGWTGALAHDLLEKLFTRAAPGGPGTPLYTLATSLLVPFVLCVLALPGAAALLWSLGFVQGLALVRAALARRPRRTPARGPAERRPPGRRRPPPVFPDTDLPPVVIPGIGEARHLTGPHHGLRASGPASGETEMLPEDSGASDREPSAFGPPVSSPRAAGTPGVSPATPPVAFAPAGAGPGTPRPTAGEPAVALPAVTLIVSGSAGTVQAPLVPLPSLNLLRASSFAGTGSGQDPDTQEALEKSNRRLEETLAEFGVTGTVSDARQGPVVTFHVFTPEEGINPARVRGLADDIARRMEVPHARVASYEGFAWLGIELANPEPRECRLYDILSRRAFQSHEGMLPLVLGRDVCGAPVVDDLTRLPFYLIGGDAGTGKTTALAALLLSLVYRLTPREARFLLVNTRQGALSAFDGIPHLVAPVVTDAAKGLNALKWLLREMENRYAMMNALSVRSIEQYNLKVREAHASGNPLRRKIQTGFSENGTPIFENQLLDSTPLGYLVVVIDEIADLMTLSPGTVETTLERLAKISRAVGIHVVASTGEIGGRVLTPALKTLFPHRGCFRTANKIDSRLMVGANGAERLPSPGEMLFFHTGVPTERIHTPHVTPDEIRRVCAFLREQAAPAYIEDVTAEADRDLESSGGDPAGPDTDTDGHRVIRALNDPLYDRAVEVVVKSRRVSLFSLQRHLKIGAPRAGALIRRMEQEGIVSAPNLAGKRDVLAPRTL